MRSADRAPARPTMGRVSFVTLTARTEATVDDFLEVIAARKTAHSAAAHRARGVSAQYHRRDQPDLVDVVTLLPPASRQT
jgi:hypothetical protein